MSVIELEVFNNKTKNYMEELRIQLNCKLHLLRKQIKYFNSNNNKYTILNIFENSWFEYNYRGGTKYSIDIYIPLHKNYLNIFKKFSLGSQINIPGYSRLSGLEIKVIYRMILCDYFDKIVPILYDEAKSVKTFDNELTFEVYRNFNYLYVDEEKLNEIFTGSDYTIDLGYHYIKCINRLNLPKVKFVSEVEE